MLKQILMRSLEPYDPPAAFGRLCVETVAFGFWGLVTGPAAFGRLCVETSYLSDYSSLNRPAAFGRLCVETSPE